MASMVVLKLKAWVQDLRNRILQPAKRIRLQGKLFLARDAFARMFEATHGPFLMRAALDEQVIAFQVGDAGKLFTPDLDQAWTEVEDAKRLLEAFEEDRRPLMLSLYDAATRIVGPWAGLMIFFLILAIRYVVSLTIAFGLPFVVAFILCGLDTTRTAAAIDGYGLWKHSADVLRIDLAISIILFFVMPWTIKHPKGRLAPPNPAYFLRRWLKSHTPSVAHFFASDEELGVDLAARRRSAENAVIGFFLLVTLLTITWLGIKYATAPTSAGAASVASQQAVALPVMPADTAGIKADIEQSQRNEIALLNDQISAERRIFLEREALLRRDLEQAHKGVRTKTQALKTSLPAARGPVPASPVSAPVTTGKEGDHG